MTNDVEKVVREVVRQEMQGFLEKLVSDLGSAPTMEVPRLRLKSNLANLLRRNHGDSILTTSLKVSRSNISMTRSLIISVLPPRALLFNEPH